MSASPSLSTASRSQAARHRSSRLSRHLIWAALLAGHTPSWLALTFTFLSSPGPAELVHWLLLSVGEAFFLFKLFDARWLHLRCDTRGWLALLFVLLLLHGDVLRRAWNGTLPEHTVAIPVLAVGSSLPLGAEHVRRCLGRACTRGLTERDMRVARRVLRDAVAVFRAPCVTPALQACRPDRAPPR